jgi:hypothetical protein
MSGATQDSISEMLKIKPTPAEIRKTTDGFIERMDSLVKDGQTTEIAEPLPGGHAEINNHTVKEIRDSNDVLLYKITRDVFPDLVGLMRYRINEYEPGKDDLPINITSLDRESDHHPIHVERMFCPSQDAEFTVVKSPTNVDNHHLETYTGRPLEAFAKLLTTLEVLEKSQEQNVQATAPTEEAA